MGYGLLGFQTRLYAATAVSQAHTRCKLVNGVYVVTLDSPNVKVSVKFTFLSTFVRNQIMILFSAYLCRYLLKWETKIQVLS